MLQTNPKDLLKSDVVARTDKEVGVETLKIGEEVVVERIREAPGAASTEMVLTKMVSRLSKQAKTPLTNEEEAAEVVEEKEVREGIDLTLLATRPMRLS